MAASADALVAYDRKRDFTKTSEPKPSARRGTTGADRFVIQRHWARREHFDLRLEHAGVLLSWAVARGPSNDPADKRLAVRTEDHPLEYADYEGVIARGQYGAGTVMIWDKGTWSPKVADPGAALTTGNLRFNLHGERVKGGYKLVRMRREEARENWLLIKDEDDFASRSDLVSEFQTSVTTGRNKDEISRDISPQKPGYRTKPIPDFSAPMLCQTAERPPDGEEWLHELKYDGYRLQIAKRSDEVRIRTREGLDWTARFPSIAAAAATLAAETAVIDGEAVVFDRRGLTNFPALVTALTEAPQQIVFVAFDLLRLDNTDYRGQTLLQRKVALDELLTAGPSALRTAPYVTGGGTALFEKVAAQGAEGIISKKADSTYRSGRSGNWLKIKRDTREDVVVVGYVPSLKGRAFGGLVTAIERNGSLFYAGRVGSGFTDEQLQSTLAKLEEQRRATPPPGLADPSKAPRKTIWIETSLRAEIALTGWTADRQMRHPRFLGWREDMATRNSAPPVLTHGERVVFPEAGITKADIAAYYGRVADLILPHLQDRLISFVRAPESVSVETFFQRHPLNGMKRGIRRVPDPDRRHDDFLMIADRSGLLTSAQFGVIELHGWCCRYPALDKPDRMVFDLDPDDKVPFSAIVEAAFQIKALLEGVNLKTYPMLSGGKGVHVIAPLDRSQDWESIELFTKGIARGMARADPSRYVATASKVRRTGKIYVDWLRNKRTATAIVPWSLRARALATIAAPVDWKKLEAATGAGMFTIRSKPLRNPWKDFFTIQQAIPEAALNHLRPLAEGR